MRRVTAAEVRSMAAHMTKVVGVNFHVEKANGGYRLEQQLSTGGCINISPRLKAGALLEWMHAYMDGWNAKDKKDEDNP